MAKEEVLIALKVANARQAKSDIDGVANSTDKLGGKAKKSGASMKKAFAGLAAGITGGLGGLAAIGSQFDAAYDTIRVGTGTTGKAFASLKDDFKAVAANGAADFGMVSTAIADLNTRLGITGKPLQDMTAKMVLLSRLTKTDISGNITSITRAFGDWEVSTKKQGDAMDFLFRASQGSGASVSQLAQQVVQFGAPLRQVGYSFEEATSMFALFEKAGVNTSTMMPGLKQAMKTFFEKGIDPKKGLAAAFEGIQNGSIKAKDALKIFGVRAGGDMIEAVQQGRFDLDKWTSSLVNGSDTLKKAGKETSSFSGKITALKNKALVALEPVAIRVFDSIGTAVESAKPYIAQATDVVKGLAEGLAAVGDVVSKFVAAFKNGNVYVQGFALAVVAVATGLKVQTMALAAWATVSKGYAAVTALMTGGTLAFNAALRANIIGIVVTAVVALVGAVYMLYKRHESVRKVVDSTWKWIKGTVGNVVDWLGPKLAFAARVIGAFATAGWSHAKRVVSAWGDVVGFFRKLPGRIAGFFSGMWDGIKRGFATGVNAVIDVLNGFIDRYNGTIGRIGGPDIEPIQPVGLASGGHVNRGGWAVVGERGPELVKLPGRSTVYDAEQTAAARASMSGPAGGALRLEVVGDDAALVELVKRLTKLQADYIPAHT